MSLRPAMVVFACLHSVAASAATGYSLINAFPNVTFANPVCIASAPGETNRLFVLEKSGVIAVITNLAAPNVSLFMGLTDRVTSPSDPDEEGLLGLEFHPGFATNGFFYVFYTGPATTSAGTGRHDILSRFTYQTRIRTAVILPRKSVTLSNMTGPTITMQATCTSVPMDISMLPWGMRAEHTVSLGTAKRSISTSSQQSCESTSITGRAVCLRTHIAQPCPV